MMAMQWTAQGQSGVRNRDHSSRIPSHVAGIKQKETLLPTQKRQNVTLCVEGNISSGKSTFLEELRKGSLELKDTIEVLPLWRRLPLMQRDK